MVYRTFGLCVVIRRDRITNKEYNENIDSKIVKKLESYDDHLVCLCIGMDVVTAEDIIERLNEKLGITVYRVEDGKPVGQDGVVCDFAGPFWKCPWLIWDRRRGTGIWNPEGADA